MLQTSEITNTLAPKSGTNTCRSPNHPYHSENRTRNLPRPSLPLARRATEVVNK